MGWCWFLGPSPRHRLAKMDAWFKAQVQKALPPGFGTYAYAGSTSSGSDDEEDSQMPFAITRPTVPEPTNSWNEAGAGSLHEREGSVTPEHVDEDTPLIARPYSIGSTGEYDNDAVERTSLISQDAHSRTQKSPTDFPDPGRNSPTPNYGCGQDTAATNAADAEDVSASGEFGILLKSAVPVILAYTLQSSLQAISILIVGRISPAALSVAAFSYMFAMSTATIVAYGGTTALDTLASSSFTGSKNRTDLGTLLQRALVVLGVLYIPVAVIWWFSGPIFRALGQEDYICEDGQSFLRWFIPGGLGCIYFESVKKYLQAQGLMRAGTYVLMITSPINIMLNYLFIYTLDFGVNGAPIATSVTYWLSFLLLCGYSKYVGGHEGWGGWSTACFKNMFTFLRLALLGTVMVGTEWWAFEIVAIISGRLGQVPLAAQSVIMTTDQVLNTIPFGIGVAASTRVGNLLGAKDARGAARAANLAAWLSMFMGTVVLIFLMSVKNFYAKLFNDDQAVIDLTADVMPYVALFQIADGLNGSCGGSLRGMGRQHPSATISHAPECGSWRGVKTITDRWMDTVALPLGIWLAYHGWGLAGLWVGQCLALYAVGIGEWALVYFSDWEVQVVQALGRLDDAERTEIGEATAITRP
ncbi:hypothetical protein Dda_1147 [Drechslerella dactyloides]|uniref:MATE efflux family protein n=1 Tax=Drechslerella dactyloides TaxID=74499 RepID=A0AAD6J6R9_DREDA|nr:hypothetical protein Dda_1147 [Drechslerella dactyloides]